MGKQYGKLCEAFDMMPLADQILFITNRVGFAKSDDIAWEYRKRQLDKF